MLHDGRSNPRFFYSKNSKYKSILDCLEKYDIKICKRTLITKLQEYGLGRRTYKANEEQARACIERELHDNGKLFSYRAMWRKLHSKYGMGVRRLTVQNVIKELDPEGCASRKAHKLNLNPGLNFAWHADGYDKLKHGCIDGFSRRIMWLEIVRTNNETAF